jgi:M6 family metalloprotease-like protein
MKRWFSCLALALMVCSTALVTASDPTEVAHDHGFHAVALQPDAAEKARAQGKSIKYPFPNSANRGNKFNPGGETLAPLPGRTGQQPVLVLFVSFSNTAPGVGAPLNMSYFDSLLFGQSYNPPEYKAAGFKNYPTNRTLKNYYKEVSYGKVDVITYNMPSQLGWLNVGKPVEHYVKGDGVHDYGFGAYPNNVLGLVEDAVKAADAQVDFSKYARDGEVPNLFVVQAGGGAEWSLDGNLIWSHAWSFTDDGRQPLLVDGVKVNNYAMMPMVGGDITGFLGQKSGPYPPTVGVFAHEYGHVLGLPDLYDYGSDGASEGVGDYSLMAGGSWNRYPNAPIFSGNSPAHMDPWSKYRLGFVSPIEITAAQTLTLPPSETSPVVYKMVVPFSNGKEYYLFENRQQIGFDQGLSRRGPAVHGLAIWHVDDVVLTRNYWRPNEAENWKELRFASAKQVWTGESHYGVSIIQADGQWDLERGIWYDLEGDLYPGKKGVTSFGSNTTPNSTSYYFWAGNDPQFGYSGVTVDTISEKDGKVTARFSFQNR